MGCPNNLNLCIYTIYSLTDRYICFICKFMTIGIAYKLQSVCYCYFVGVDKDDSLLCLYIPEKVS